MPKRQIEAKAEDTRTVIVDDNYQDAAGNRWMIRIAGDAAVVQAFRDGGRLDVGAEPLTPDQWSAQVARSREQAAARKPSTEPARDRENERQTLEILAMLTVRDLSIERYRGWYHVYVPAAGSSRHDHTVFVGGDTSIDLEMGGIWAGGLSGTLDVQTQSMALLLFVYEDGATYTLSGDWVWPPGN
jgi:hypothetical protein